MFLENLTLYLTFLKQKCLSHSLLFHLQCNGGLFWYPGSEPGGGGYVAQRMLAAKDEKNAVGATFLYNIAHYALRPWPWILIALASLIVVPMSLSENDKDIVFVHEKANEVLADVNFKNLENGLVLAIANEDEDQISIAKVQSLMISNEASIQIKALAFLYNGAYNLKNGDVPKEKPEYPLISTELKKS